MPDTPLCNVRRIQASEVAFDKLSDGAFFYSITQNDRDRGVCHQIKCSGSPAAVDLDFHLINIEKGNPGNVMKAGLPFEQ